jgi:hypothetical protein
MWARCAPNYNGGLEGVCNSAVHQHPAARCSQHRALCSPARLQQSARYLWLTQPECSNSSTGACRPAQGRLLQPGTSPCMFMCRPATYRSPEPDLAHVSKYTAHAPPSIGSGAAVRIVHGMAALHQLTLTRQTHAPR